MVSSSDKISHQLSKSSCVMGRRNSLSVSNNMEKHTSFIHVMSSYPKEISLCIFTNLTTYQCLRFFWYLSSPATRIPKVSLARNKPSEIFDMIRLKTIVIHQLYRMNSNIFFVKDFRCHPVVSWNLQISALFCISTTFLQCRAFDIQVQTVQSKSKSRR